MSWRERIAAARARGGFSPMDKTMAANWMTCAVGEQRAMYPGVVKVVDPLWFGAPTDDQLRVLGGGTPGGPPFSGFAGFGWAVLTNDFARAEALLDAIEDRVLVLKREAGA